MWSWKHSLAFMFTSSTCQSQVGWKEYPRWKRRTLLCSEVALRKPLGGSGWEAKGRRSRNAHLSLGLVCYSVTIAVCDKLLVSQGWQMEMLPAQSTRKFKGGKWTPVVTVDSVSVVCSFVCVLWLGLSWLRVGDSCWDLCHLKLHGKYRVLLLTQALTHVQMYPGRHEVPKHRADLSVKPL